MLRAPGRYGEKGNKIRDFSKLANEHRDTHWALTGVRFYQGGENHQQWRAPSSLTAQMWLSLTLTDR